MSKRVTLTDREMTYILAIMGDSSNFVIENDGDDWGGALYREEVTALALKLGMGWKDISRTWPAGDRQQACRIDGVAARREAA